MLSPGDAARESAPRTDQAGRGSTPSGTAQASEPSGARRHQPVSILESYFFRTPAQFELLREQILPTIGAGLRRGERLRVLSAGCARGEEVYSVAILLEELGLIGRAEIVGADVSDEALRCARAAEYGAWSLRRDWHGFRERHFLHGAGRWRLRDTLRDRVRFVRSDLGDPAGAAVLLGRGAWHLILCRNVLVYFPPDLLATTATRLGAALAPGGWLLTAPTDPPFHALDGIEPVPTRGGTLYHRPRPGNSERRAPRRSDAACVAPKPLREVVAAAPATVAAAPEPLSRPAASVAGDLEALLAEARDLGDRGDLAAALAAARRVVERFPARAEAHYVEGLLLDDQGMVAEASQAFRRAAYLAQDLAVAHLRLGLTRKRLSDAEGARRALRRAVTLLGGLAADAPVPLAPDEPAGRLRAWAEEQLLRLGGAIER